MNKKGILLMAFIVWLSCNGVTYAQEITREGFERAVDLFNCHTVEYSAKLGLTKGAAANFQKEIGGCGNKIDIVKIRKAAKDSGDQASIDLAEEIETIKTTEHPSDKTWIVEYFSSNIFNESNKPKLAGFVTLASGSRTDPKTKTDYIPLDRLKERLKTGLSGLLADVKLQNNNTKNANINGQINTNSNSNINTNDGNNKVNTNSNTNTSRVGGESGSFSWFDLIYFLPLLATIVFGVKFWLDARREFTSISDRIDKVNRRLNEVEDTVATSKMNLSVTANKEATELENKLDKKIKKLEADIETLRPFKPTHSQEASRELNHQPAPREEVFYLPTPNEDGSFNVNFAQQSYDSGASIYKFIRSPLNKSQATFQIDEREESVNMALRYPDANISPVCTALNSRSNDEKRIVTTELGTAELDGDKWILKEKAKIRYE